jgi:environmental stress-induced protein Ves
MRIIRAAERRVMPWKNGGGTTTEIAVFPEGASLGDFDWRISTAHVGQDGPFSSFPGIDRTLVVLNGGGICLAFADGEAVTLARGSQPLAFDADRAVTGLLVAGPIDDLNVMSRRGRWRHEVRRLGAGPHALEIDAGLLVLVACAGGWTIKAASDGTSLAAGDSVILDGPQSAEIVAAEADAELFAITLRPVA